MTLDLYALYQDRPEFGPVLIESINEDTYWDNINERVARNKHLIYFLIEQYTVQTTEVEAPGFKDMPDNSPLIFLYNEFTRQVYTYPGDEAWVQVQAQQNHHLIYFFAHLDTSNIKAYEPLAQWEKELLSGPQD